MRATRRGPQAWHGLPLWLACVPAVARPRLGRVATAAVRLASKQEKGRALGASTLHTAMARPWRAARTSAGHGQGCGVAEHGRRVSGVRAPGVCACGPRCAIGVRRGMPQRLGARRVYEARGSRTLGAARQGRGLSRLVWVCVGFAATARWMGTPAAKRLGGGDERRVSVEGTPSSRYTWIKGETR